MIKNYFEDNNKELNREVAMIEQMTRSVESIDSLSHKLASVIENNSVN